MGIDRERKYSKHERFNVMQEIEKNTERIYQQEGGGRGGSGLAALWLWSFSDLKPAVMTSAMSMSDALARCEKIGVQFPSANSVPSALELRKLC
jgi:hypothetical protein